MRQLGNGNDVVARAIRGPHRVSYLKIKHAVHGELRVVPGNTNLTGHIERHFLERVLVGHPVHEGDDQIQTRRQSLGVLAEPLDDPGLLLGNLLDPFAQKDNRHHQNDESDNSGAAQSGQFVQDGHDDRWLVTIGSVLHR